jgi:hypothetical protein
MADNIEVKLSKAYKLGGKETNTISFREPKVADLITIENIARDGGQHAVTTLMMAVLSGAQQSEIGEFSLPDYAACDRALRPFTKVADEGGGD